VIGFLKSQSKYKWIWLTVTGLVLIIGLVVYLLSRPPETKETQNTNKTDTDSEAVVAGKSLSNNKCEGTGHTALTSAPMNYADVHHVEPYGLMIGAHVMPIDHWYFSPADFNSPRDTYPVYAMGDATITDISRRTSDTASGRAKTEEFRLVFTQSCTFFYYYDLVTSLSQDILDQASELQTKDYVSPSIKVKAGDLIGRIGGQTLDFAVWDTTKPLTGFINPDSYKGESWKIYTANPLDYVSQDVKDSILAKLIRTTEPIQGKIDYDQEGKLVGNWFLENTNGYAGKQQEGYWSGHLAVVYNYIDQTAIQVSIGDWQGEATQFSVAGNAPDPATINAGSGIVKYELGQVSYVDSNGRFINFSTDFVKDAKISNPNQIQGTILLQLTEKHKLKVELFPNKTAKQVAGFSSAAKIYVR
jgi:hypothetical protein